jgi:glucokinase
MDKAFPVLGFDIGGTKIALCLGTSDGRILGSTRVDNKNRAPELVLPELVQAGRRLLSEAKVEQKELRAIGIGSPAPMDFLKGMILTPPNMKTWRNVAIRDYLGEAFGVEAFFDNDANGGGLAEWIFGAGKGAETMLYLTMSTGIGGGIIANGRLLRGKSFIAGEVGHVVIDPNGPKCNCGLTGCYEAFCGGRALAQRMQAELADKPGSFIVKAVGGKLDDIDVGVLVKAVRAKDPYAVALWEEMCLRNAQAIGIFINTFNPDMIVLGTIAVHTGDLFMKPLMKDLPRFCWEDALKPCKILPSALGAHIGEYSGIAIALNFLYERGDWQLPWQAKA